MSPLRQRQRRHASKRGPRVPRVRGDVEGHSSEAGGTDTVTCPDCGKSIAIGSWPFCKDGHEPASIGARGDEIPGGMTLENLGPDPVTVYSRSELKRELAARGLVEMVRHVPVPGTDRSPFTTSWTAVDLEAGKALAERQAHTRAPRDDGYRPDETIIAETKRVYAEIAADTHPTIRRPR